jgi:hypothetical protein
VIPERAAQDAHPIAGTELGWQLDRTFALMRNSRQGKKAENGRIGRPRQWAEDMQARFSKGTFVKIEALLREGEERTEFVRQGGRPRDRAAGEGSAAAPISVSVRPSLSETQSLNAGLTSGHPLSDLPNFDVSNERPVMSRRYLPCKAACLDPHQGIFGRMSLTYDLSQETRCGSL